jgi:NDP-sugar pyrophosphorylase family protein
MTRPESGELRAVVLAAGDGGRMAPHTDTLPKPLLPLRGRPIIGHVLEALAAGGVRDATIVVGYRAEQMRRAMGDVAPRGMSLRLAENPNFELGNARSLWTARDASTPPFVLAMGDHLIEPALVRAVARDAGTRSRLAIERVRPDDPRAAEATRAEVRDGRVVALGKRLPRWNALDTGTFWCTRAALDAIDDGNRDGELSDVFACLAATSELDAVEVTGHRWIDIDTLDDLRRAEAMLGDGRAA